MRDISLSFLDPLVRTGSVRQVFEGGCGTGHFASLVAERYRVPVTAADLDRVAARMAAKRHGVVCVQANMLALPFRSHRFDLVLLMDVLAHFAPGGDLTLLQEVSRVLRPGGHLLLRASAFDVFRSMHSEFVWEVQRFTASRLQALATQSGLVPIRTTYANFFLSPLALIKFRVWEPLRRQPPSTGLVPLPAPVERLFCAVLRAERVLLSRGLNLPFGQSVFMLARKDV